ncbi:DegT/DnrJ/EryC1/StrS family aminotransferase [Oceanobacillus oncorhynchi]|uniref:DegT/DnrJ/EryC1/StrS family aminotransferase n=1 Tax=Oceanobacillus oncorhynchi TaxID=545501 RepID=UPI0034D65793
MNTNIKKNIPFSPPDISNEEINEVIKTLNSGWITTGPKTKEFEQRIAEYIGVDRAVCLNSATACMEMTLRILGVGPGDEVITSAYTYTATASVINHVGARIVLVDTAEDSYEMDPAKLEEAITEKTKVIISIDIAGKIANYESIYKIVEKKKHIFRPNNEIQNSFNRIIVLADAAHAFGSTQNDKKAGMIADFTCFSFHAVKNLTTAEGGAVVWKNNEKLNNDEIYNNYMLLSLHGQSKDALSKSQKGSWEYDIIYPAFKCNMTDIMASVGLIQLQRYQDQLDKRKQIIEQYDRGLQPLNLDILKHYRGNFASSGHLYLVRIENINEDQRNEIINRMAEYGVSCNVHYKPLPLLTAYKNLGFKIEDYPNAYKQYQNVITLPLHTLLSKEDVEYVISMFKKVIKEVSTANII